MSQEIKLDEDTKSKIKLHLQQFEQTESTSINRLYEVLEKLGALGENGEIRSFHNTLGETTSKKHTVLSQFTELKEAIDLDLGTIIETDEELSQRMLKIGEVVTGGGDE